LDALVNVCESGYEVHVVLVAQQGWHDNDAEVYAKSRFLCMRLRRDVAVVVRYHRHVGKPLDTVLASIHRGLFVQLKNYYDLFLSQEDDMLVTVQNVRYFEKWAAKFGGTTLYPGFAIAEAATPGFAVHDLYRRATIVWNTHTHRRRLFIFKHDDTLLLAHAKAWAPLYFLTRDLLDVFASTPEWMEDASRPWVEINAHFQHMWLARHMTIVVPLEDVEDSFVLHTPGNYIAHAMTVNANATEHDHAVELDELKAILADCVGREPTSSWSVDGITYAPKLHEPLCANSVQTPLTAPCNACTSKDMAVDIDLTFPRALPALSGIRASAPSVNLCCIDTASIPQQEVAGLRQRRR